MPLQGRIPAQFDDDAWAQDLTRTTSNGRQAATVARAAYEQAGVAINDLRPCQPQGNDGTQLSNCLKVYLPAPNGRFGIVWRAKRFPTGLRLIFLAFGVRHHPRQSHAPTGLPTCPSAPTRHQRLRPGDRHPNGAHQPTSTSRLRGRNNPSHEGHLLPRCAKSHPFVRKAALRASCANGNPPRGL